jgi:hypothetical protein
MNARHARKVVVRYHRLPGSYTPEQVTRAHTVARKEVNEEHMALYTQARTLSQADAAACVADMVRRAEANKAKRVEAEANRVKRREAIVQRRVEAAAAVVEAAPVVEETVPVETTNVEDLTVPELKALCKGRGLKGYSKLKKPELLDLLTGKQ